LVGVVTHVHHREYVEGTIIGQGLK